MTDKPRYVRPLSPESKGEAPGRKRLEGRRILVVGGGQRTFDAATDPVGNGRAMSLLFAKEGAHVAVADIFRASADDTVARITAEGGRGFSIEADIAREADVSRMVDEAVDGLGGLDGMVLNVGIGVGCPGLVDTPLGRHTSAGRPSRSAAGVPFGRMATGWEIAYAALFFMSEESVYINAQTLAVDSGITGL